MRRRDVIAGLAGAALPTLPIGARAQQPALPVIGYLASESREGRPELLAAFQRGLAEIGYVEGRTAIVDARWADGRFDRLQALATDLVRRRVAAIGAIGTQAALVGKAATQTIPIVFVVGADPAEIGLVASLNRPGSNLTGVSILSPGVATKRLELLHEAVPAAKLIGLLVNPTNPVLAEAQASELQIAARALGTQLVVLNASDPQGIEDAFDALVSQQAGALLVSDDPVLNTQRVQLAVLAARYAVPTIYQFRESTVSGGLMSYGPSLPDAVRQVGAYVGRIIKGEKPAELPVVQSAKFEFVINLHTARSLRINISPTVLALADEVIE
jgi:ABC-type uncharacterized transport system substrate-binding protein